MIRWWRLPNSAVSKSACGSWSGCSAARPWRSRSSRRRSTSHGQKTDLAVALAASGRYPVRTVSTTLGVARSNVVERRDGKRPRRGAQERVGDVELVGAIRRLVDARPTYGYRRIAALLKRERRSDGMAPVNAKRVYRLMKKHGLLLERYTGRRRV